MMNHKLMNMSKYEEIFGKEWACKLGPFLESDEFKSIGKTLKSLKDNGTQIFPGFSDMFRAFRLCDYNDVKIVFLTNNCFVNGEGDGLAFSFGGPELRPPEISDVMFNALEVDFELYLERKYNLDKWAEQGVLLLNVDLSTVQGKHGSHIELWKPFTEQVLTELANYQTGVIYVLIGREAAKYEKFINKQANDCYILEHPMIALKEKRPWNHEFIFQRINRICQFIHNDYIDWTGTLKPHGPGYDFDYKAH